MQTRNFPQKKWIVAQMNPTGYRLKLDFLFLCPLKLGFRAIFTWINCVDPH
jgi:hypothetical protein